MVCNSICSKLSSILFSFCFYEEKNYHKIFFVIFFCHSQHSSTVFIKNQLSDTFFVVTKFLLFTNTIFGKVFFVRMNFSHNFSSSFDFFFGTQKFVTFVVVCIGAIICTHIEQIQCLPYWCYHLHMSRYTVTLICGIFVFLDYFPQVLLFICQSGIFLSADYSLFFN